MKTDGKFSRRQFLEAASAGTLASRSSLTNVRESPAVESSRMPVSARLNSSQPSWILTTANPTFQEKLAARELSRGLRKLGLAGDCRLAALPGAEPRPQESVFNLLVSPERFKQVEAYEIAVAGNDAKNSGLRLNLTAASPQATLYAVFDFLQRQGVFFGLDGEVYPLDLPQALNVPVRDNPWRATPRFNARGLVPWPDFLNCITVFNSEDYRAYIEAMLRMRYNMLGIHVYSGPNQWAESFLSFEYGGIGHLAYTDTTASNRWGYLPQRTSRFGMGAPQFYDSEVFGSDATRLARSPWEAAEMAQQLWRDAFQYAGKLGIQTGVGFEPYMIPDEIFRALPPEARLDKRPEDPGPRVDVDSVAARDVLETRLGQLLEAYPSVDYVWLWEDEGMSWASQRSNVPLSVTPFQQAHDFLQRHAPQKRLVLAGWGGVARHFESFHRLLPDNVIFACLSNGLGWQPVNEAFGKLEGREHWPILWLEDDPSMWLPQFHVHRFHEDMKRAEQFGCQGLLGIHWRHRIMDPNAGFHSRACWEEELEPSQYYKSYCGSLARQPRSEKLAELLNQTDRDRRLMCTKSAETQKGNHHLEYAADYDEGFVFWKGYEIPPQVLQSQQEVAKSLSEVAASAASLEERERLTYLSKHVELLVPYADAWALATQLHRHLQDAVQLKQAGKAEEARRRIEREGLPLWVLLTPKVREVMLDFQQIISTRNDLGALASMHNKLVRLALFRLPASMKEFLSELPEEVKQIQSKAVLPDAKENSRIFLPTRPSILTKGETVRVSAIAPGPKPVVAVLLFTRPAGTKQWTHKRMQLAGRRTFTGQLGPFEDASNFIEYYVEAQFSSTTQSRRITAPAEAPQTTYSLTLV
jgi:hypothetical protein